MMYSFRKHAPLPNHHKIQEGEKIEENKLFPDPFFKLAIFYNRR
jgi:hypothetical protein